MPTVNVELDELYNGKYMLFLVHVGSKNRTPCRFQVEFKTQYETVKAALAAAREFCTRHKFKIGETIEL